MIDDDRSALSVDRRMKDEGMRGLNRDRSSHVVPSHVAFSRKQREGASRANTSCDRRQASHIHNRTVRVS